MSKYFTLSQTYSDITPESAEIGDFDDSDFEIEKNNDYSLSEAFKLIQNQGAEYIELQNNRFFVTSGYFTICYLEGRERQLTIFLEFKNKKHAKKIFEIFQKRLKLF